MTPDTINGLFELFGSAMIWINIRALYRAKRYEGVSLAPVFFWSSWGLWNLFYYPHLGQIFSFLGGCSVVAANTINGALMFYYARHRKPAPPKWIQTFTGKQFNFADPQPDQICIEDIAHALANICRFNGHIKTHYSVAAHSVIASYLVPKERRARRADARLRGSVRRRHDAAAQGSGRRKL
jgi:hypothetical protein